MALTRSAILKAMDAGRWLIIKNVSGSDKGDSSTNTSEATRYPTLATFDSQAANTYWYPNQWGDQSKTVLDAANGYQIRDHFFSDTPATPTLGVAPTPNVAAGAKTPNSYDRTQVLYSYDLGQYIYVPNTGDPVTAWQVYTVSNAWQATRFDNLATVLSWLQSTQWGFAVNGYGIEQFAFTKAPTTPFASPASAPSGNSNNITRAYVPYSNQQGAYLYIANPSDPIPSMSFSWVGNPWEGARFQNLNTFKAIVDGRPDFFGVDFRAGWEVPQFYFTQAARPPRDNPFEEFFTNDPCGQSASGDKYGNMYQFIVAYAGGYCDWGEFYAFMWYDVFGGNWPDFYDWRCFEEWFNNQDHNALEQWLHDIWRANTPC